MGDWVGSAAHNAIIPSSAPPHNAIVPSCKIDALDLLEHQALFAHGALFIGLGNLHQALVAKQMPVVDDKQTHLNFNNTQPPLHPPHTTYPHGPHDGFRNPSKHTGHRGASSLGLGGNWGNAGGWTGGGIALGGASGCIRKPCCTIPPSSISVRCLRDGLV